MDASRLFASPVMFSSLRGRQNLVVANFPLILFDKRPASRGSLGRQATWNHRLQADKPKGLERRNRLHSTVIQSTATVEDQCDHKSAECDLPRR